MLGQHEPTLNQRIYWVIAVCPVCIEFEILHICFLPYLKLYNIISIFTHLTMWMQITYLCCANPASLHAHVSFKFPLNGK